MLCDATSHLQLHPCTLHCCLCSPSFLPAAKCPHGWLSNGRSCYTMRRRGLTWSEAQNSCKHLAAGSHLAHLKTHEDLQFLSSQLLSHNNLLLLWTGLSDQEVNL
uniref:C-type lectin domain-containing protein n=1 Tax=Echeneis naucrates TaxID=173247 RepID=A0A665VL66_ECHNA